MGQVSTDKEYFRQDGVRISHDPYAPGMAEKYGQPGETDNEGFDPYADTVGPGIYGGIVQRDSTGQIVIGEQYQNHNPTPGPIYGIHPSFESFLDWLCVAAGGGYTPMSRALGDAASLQQLLAKFPDLVNDISTGGAQPLHSCGMSRAGEQSTSLLIEHGADIEALDTYGFTPLHRMASNNLAIGAKALLDAGADPRNRGGVGQTPMQIAQSAFARDVIAVLKAQTNKRKRVPINRIVVAGAGVPEVNQEYHVTDPAKIPSGFEAVCRAQGWDHENMWQSLNQGRDWFSARNGAYIYWNESDAHWWIDTPDGNGAYKAIAPDHAPPQTGWKLLGDSTLPPALVATFRH